MYLSVSITTAECYPFMGYGSCEASMGEHSYTTTCINDDSEGYLYRMPMQYKVSPNENYIKYEIQTNGPVQGKLSSTTPWRKYLHVKNSLTDENDYFL